MESGIDPGQDYYAQEYYNYEHGLVCVCVCVCVCVDDFERQIISCMYVIS